MKLKQNLKNPRLSLSPRPAPPRARSAAAPLVLRRAMPRLARCQREVRCGSLLLQARGSSVVPVAATANNTPHATAFGRVRTQPCRTPHVEKSSVLQHRSLAQDARAAPWPWRHVTAHAHRVRDRRWQHGESRGG